MIVACLSICNAPACCELRHSAPGNMQLMSRSLPYHSDLSAFLGSCIHTFPHKTLVSVVYRNFQVKRAFLEKVQMSFSIKSAPLQYNCTHTWVVAALTECCLPSPSQPPSKMITLVTLLNTALFSLSSSSWELSCNFSVLSNKSSRTSWVTTV